MTPELPGRLRPARAEDVSDLLRLWGLLFDDDVSGAPWADHAAGWFAQSVNDGASARLPVIEVGDELVATAVGSLELGVPNPFCPRGRTVRLANVITLPTHRRRGFGTTVTLDVVQWARSISADRVDLSATADGLTLYERVGFVPTSAPRMKLVL